MNFSFPVNGLPAPQGSKSFKGMRIGKRGQSVPVLVESSKSVKPWRAAVVMAAREYAGLHNIKGVRVKGKQDHVWIAGPVMLYVDFFLPRPKKTKFKVPAAKPDLSKLLRATEDALTTAGCWEDDSRVVVVNARKFWGDPGAVIRIESFDA